MRPASFFDWLDDLTDTPVGRAVKTVLAGALLLALCYGGYQLVRDSQAQTRATNERLARELEATKKPRP